MEKIEIKQITPIYDEIEDRVRLIININSPNRYDLMLTRKFLIDIVDNIAHYLNIKVPKTTSSTENSTKKPIYETLDENLLTSFSLTKKDENFVLTLKDKKREYQAILTPIQLKNLFDMILDQVGFRWGIMI